MTRASKEIYLNVDKLRTLPVAEQADLEPQNALLLQQDHEHVIVKLEDLREYASGDFSDRADELEDVAEELTDRVVALEAATASDGDDKNFVFEKAVADTLWTIVHNLGKFPSVFVIDSAGTAVTGAVNYVDPNTLTVEFVGAMGGQAILN